MITQKQMVLKNVMNTNKYKVYIKYNYFERCKESK